MSENDAVHVTAHGQWRLFAAAFLTWVMAAALVHVPGAARVVGVVLLASGTIAIIAIAKSGSRQFRQTGVIGMVMLTIAMMLFVCARIETHEQARSFPVLVAASESSESQLLGVSLAGYPESIHGYAGEERSWVRGKLMRIEGEELVSPVAVMLWLPDVAPDRWAPGTPVSMTGVLKRAPPESQTAFEIRVTEYAEQPIVGRGSFAASLGQFAAELRLDLRQAASTVPGAELVPGFAVGDTALVSDELDALMKASSLTHLVAVSGSNTGLVVTACIAIASRLGAGRRSRPVMGAAALGLFVVVVGPDASVQRASIMAIVLLVSGFGGKRGAALPALGLAIFVLVAIDPWQSVQAGFALSVTATAGILVFTAQPETWLRTRLRLPRMLALPLSVACVAQLSVAPLLLLLQPGLPAGGVIANLLAAPAAPLGTGLGLAALIALPIAPFLGELLLFLAMLPARWVEASGEVALLLPGSRWYWPGGWGGALLLAGVEALALIAVILASGRLELRGGKAVAQTGPWGRIIRAAAPAQILLRVLAAVSAGVTVAVTIVVPVTVTLGIPKDWVMVMCDVGQGDAILLRDPENPGHTILVDTGDDETKLNECLALFGVSQISLLVLTHDDRDHVGALGAVLDRSHQVLVSPAAAKDRQFRSLTSKLDRASVPWAIGHTGLKGGDWSEDTLAARHGLHWEVLAPEVTNIPETTNAASLVLMVSVAGQRILLLGDTGEVEQRTLQRGQPNLVADVVKVAHHGSRDQAPGFYESLGARFALISAGAENRHGHPHDDVIDSLVGAGVNVLRTDVYGSVALRLRGDGLEPWAAGSRSSVTVGMSR